MKFALKKLPPAEAEEIEAACWYDEQQAGLGDRFLDAVDAAIRSLSHNALIHRVRYADVRRVGVPGFPNYGVFYYVKSGEVRIISVFHGSRDPRWLHERRKQLG
jgi:plasmid stabilization system protein ParE